MINHSSTDHGLSCLFGFVYRVLVECIRSACCVRPGRVVATVNRWRCWFYKDIFLQTLQTGVVIFKLHSVISARRYWAIWWIVRYCFKRLYNIYYLYIYIIYSTEVHCKKKCLLRASSECVYLLTEYTESNAYVCIILYYTRKRVVRDNAQRIILLNHK